MEGFDIDNIEEIITDWYFTNNDEMSRLGLEFIEVTKNPDEGTFEFSFKRNSHNWALKYEFGQYYFECEDEAEENLVGVCNDLISNVDEERSVSQDDPNEGVVCILKRCLVKPLQEDKKKASEGATPNENMDIDGGFEDNGGFDEEIEGEDIAGWSDEEYDEEADPKMEKNSSSINNQIDKYNVNLGTKDSIKIFNKLQVVLEAQETALLIETYLKDTPETFQIQIYEPLLMFKLTIDLNFMSVEPQTYESLGFDMQEVVEYLFIFDDNKLLMFMDDKTIYEKTMAELCGLGILKIEFLQQANENSQNRYQSYLQLLHETFFNKREDGTSISEELKVMDDDDLAASKTTLLEMGFTSTESEKALKKNKFSVQGAINYLIGKKSKKSEEVKIEEDEFVDFDPKHMLFSNITGKQLKDNMVLNYFRYMVYSLDSIQNYCCICRDKLLKTSTKIKCCDKELCEFSFEEALGIYISPEIKNDKQSFVLDLSIFAECVMSARAAKTFEPFPSFFLKDREMRSKRGYLDNIKEARLKGGEAKDVKESNKDIKTIRNLFKFIPSVEKCLAKCSDDQVLINTIQKQTKEPSEAQQIYKLLRYLCCTNRVNFRLLKGEEALSGDSAIQEFIIYNHDANQEKVFQELKQKHGSIFTFHGSSIENWYSILRNGPRNLSNTKMMTAGAAYGQGVYSATAFATASGYCGYRGGYNNTGTMGQGATWKHSIVKGKSVIGILEIVKKKEYNKSGDYGIVVCPDDHCIMLRYIWVFSHGTSFAGSAKAVTTQLGFDAGYYEQINKINLEKREERKLRLQVAHQRAQERLEEQRIMKEKLDEQLKERDKAEEDKKYENKIEKLETNFSGKGSATATKRILKEYKHFQTSADIENFEIKFKNENNFYQWTVILDILKFELTEELKQDFEYAKEQSSKDPTLEFEIVFSNAFPFDPPFIRVVKPIFKFHTGHVTIGGSLCMESLTPSGWSSARSIEGLFVEILSIILQGGARLDKGRLGQCYSIQEAKAAFDRVARHHGWL